MSFIEFYFEELEPDLIFETVLFSVPGHRGHLVLVRAEPTAVDGHRHGPLRRPAALRRSQRQPGGQVGPATFHEGSAHFVVFDFTKFLSVPTFFFYGYGNSCLNNFYRVFLLLSDLVSFSSLPKVLPKPAASPEAPQPPAEDEDDIMRLAIAMSLEGEPHALK